MYMDIFMSISFLSLSLSHTHTHTHTLINSLTHSFLIYLSSLSAPKEDERYDQVSDVRTQLKFFEQLDQMEKQRKEEQEREILMKAAKVTWHP